MPPFWLQMQILVPGAKPFQKATHSLEFDPDGEENAAYDIWSIESQVIPPLASYTFKTGIATAFPNEWGGIVMDRGGMGIKGSIRRAGLVDAGYRDQWLICLFNSSSKPIEIQSVLENPNAKAMAQVIFTLRGHAKPKIVDQLPPAYRGLNREGSTDAHTRS